MTVELECIVRPLRSPNASGSHIEQQIRPTDLVALECNVRRAIKTTDFLALHYSTYTTVQRVSKDLWH